MVNRKSKKKSKSSSPKKSKKVKFVLRKNKTKFFLKNHVLDPEFKREEVRYELFKGKNITILKKKEFDIWYDTKVKYPLLVAEPIDESTFEYNENVRRDVVGDSFKKDPHVDKDKSFVESDYRIYMEYGGSMGHNAPAGYHKTNLDVYEETFHLSNVCPQEINFNAGVWVLLETWCKDFYLEHQNYNLC